MEQGKQTNDGKDREFAWILCSNHICTKYEKYRKGGSVTGQGLPSV
jgi:hypothetical protein